MEKLERRAPGFPSEGFAHAVSLYATARTPEPTNAAVRDELDEMAERAIDLCILLGDRTDKLDDFLAAREAKHGAVGLAKRLRDDLRQLMGIAEMARRDAEATTAVGRSISPRTRLVADLADVLERSGMPVDARANGPLAQAFAIALESVGEGVGDPSGSVKSALTTISRNNRSRTA